MSRNDLLKLVTPTHLLMVISAGVCALIFYPFVIDLALAAIFALGLHPTLVTFRKFVQRRFPKAPLWIKRSVGAMTIGLVFFISMILMLTALSQSYETIKDLANDEELRNNLVQNLVGGWEQVQNLLRIVTDTVGFGEDILSKSGQYVANAGRFILGGLTAVLTQVPNFLMHFFVLIVFVLLFLAKAPIIFQYLSKHPFCKNDGFDELVTILQTTSQAVVASNLLIGTVQATIVTLGASIAGHGHWAITFVGTFICSFIPLIGAAPIALLLGAISYWSADTKGAIIMLVTAVIAGSIDNVIRPMMVAASQKNLNVFVSFIAIIGAVMVLGFPGLFIGPFALALLVNLYTKSQT